jgi:hypothetical protein
MATKYHEPKRKKVKHHWRGNIDQWLKTSGGRKVEDRMDRYFEKLKAKA